MFMSNQRQFRPRLSLYSTILAILARVHLIVMFSGVSSGLQVPDYPDDSERVVFPPLEHYTTLLIKNNFWSILNLGTKYRVVDLGLRDLQDPPTSKIVLRGKQTLSFLGVRPCNIDMYDETGAMVFQIHFLTGASTCFPVLRGVHVVDTFGTTLGHVQEDSSVCSRNDFIIKDYAMKITYAVNSKFNFCCEGPEFVIKEKDNQTTALIYRKGQQFMTRFANSGISPSVKALIIAFCLFLNVRGNLRLSNACMKP